MSFNRRAASAARNVCAYWLITKREVIQLIISSTTCSRTAKSGHGEVVALVHHLVAEEAEVVLDSRL